jgi:glycine/D-amino acid oxidase-like deaminating enzyme
MSQTYDVLIVGAGVYGTTAAVELSARGYRVALLDPGPLPHPLAASTDISKVVRIGYGADEFYMALGEEALRGWRRWNEEFSEPLYHNVGVTMLARAPMEPGGYEYESYQLLLKRGHSPERLNADEISRRFPAWKPGSYVDGFYHSDSGFAESGRVIETLLNIAQRQGTKLLPGQTFSAFIESDNRVTGIRTREGEMFHADHVLIAAGAWTPFIVPELMPHMRSTGHPVFHLVPPHPELFTPPNFAVFTADVAKTGWYGFPLHPHAKVVKIASHGVGQLLHPETDARVVTPDDEAHLRAMLRETFPDLADAPIVYTRRCLYNDTKDEDFWIARHPQREGLTIAAGDSGHGFKFAPVLGGIISDAVEGRENPWLHRFRWRDISTVTLGKEEARFHG